MKAFKGFLIWVDVRLSSLSRSRAALRLDTVEVVVITEVGEMSTEQEVLKEWGEKLPDAELGDSSPAGPHLDNGLENKTPI